MPYTHIRYTKNIGLMNKQIERAMLSRILAKVQKMYIKDIKPIILYLFHFYHSYLGHSIIDRKIGR